AMLVAIFIFGSHAAAANRSFTIAPPPSWVEQVALPAGDADDAATKATYLLLDHQVHVSGGAVERYERRAKKVFTAAALSDAAQIELEFEPSYQQLTIHHVRIQRGGQAIDALKPGDIKIINQEDELDQQLYNGRRSALIVLDDVRQGDVIDYAYTITGSNPVLAGRYADTYVLADGLPAAAPRSAGRSSSGARSSQATKNGCLRPCASCRTTCVTRASRWGRIRTCRISHRWSSGGASAIAKTSRCCSQPS